MRILIAEDDRSSRVMLETVLSKWGYSVSAVEDGGAALQALRSPDSPSLAILDWNMPNLDGPEVCRLIRASESSRPPYIIMLTGRGGGDDIVAALEAGADDYIVKPFNRAELHARVRAGERMVRLQSNLADRVQELELALARVKQLQGLLPICSYCKKIRDDKNYWQQVESYLAERGDVRFSHGICPECYDSFVRPQLDNLTKATRKTT